MRTKAAILVESKKPLVVDEIELPTLDVGQVLVKILYTTICGAQINEIDAVKGPDKFLPHLLGHEASGRVEEIGAEVSHVKPGDAVVLHWRPGLGIQAKPATYMWDQAARFPSGKPATIREKVNAGCVTTFQEYAVVSENRVTPIPNDFDMKIAPLLGCAVTTAAGVVCNDAEVKLGDSVVVFGVGGVGLNVVQFAHARCAHPIVAIDRHAHRLKEALLPRRDEVDYCITLHGSTHEIDVTKADVRAEVLKIVGAGGADKVIEATGKEINSRLGFELTRQGGTFVGVGVPEPTEPSDQIDLVHRDRLKELLGKRVLYEGRWIMQSHGGDCHPEDDIPRIIKLIQAGRLSLDGQITHTFSLDKINDAIDLMRSGACGRVLIDMGHEVKNTVQERKVCDFDQPIGI